MFKVLNKIGQIRVVSKQKYQISAHELHITHKSKIILSTCINNYIYIPIIY